MATFHEKHGAKVRYGIVGVANTALDFILLFLFVHLGINRIVANYFSTGIALVFSFFVNKSFTFKETDGNAKKQFIYFLIITAIGLWVIQPFIIWGVTSILDMHITSAAAVLFIAKCIASVATLIWNYLFYSRVVFKEST